jgi:hypothetical protein
LLPRGVGFGSDVPRLRLRWSTSERRIRTVAAGRLGELPLALLERPAAVHSRGGDVGDLSPHFSRREFRSGDGEMLDPPCKLLCVLEAIRAIAGRPLPIVSGFRSPLWNAKVGGVPKSFHLSAQAADIPPGFVDEAGARRAGAGGVGLNSDGWAIHVDVGPVRTWRY